MRKNGFTLIEVIIAMSVGALIMVAVYGYMTLVQKNAANSDRKIVTLQDTRAVLDLMATEIRMVSYNPRGVPTTWSNPSPLACMPITYKGIKQADANNLAVAMDLDGSGTIGDGPNEYIVYSYDGSSTITRSVSGNNTCGNATAILGGSAPYSNVRNTIGATTIVPLFQYFGCNDTTCTCATGSENALAAPINPLCIRRVLITIVADTADIDLNTKQPKRMVYSTSVWVRNHAFN